MSKYSVRFSPRPSKKYRYNDEKPVSTSALSKKNEDTPKKGILRKRAEGEDESSALSAQSDKSAKQSIIGKDGQAKPARPAHAVLLANTMYNATGKRNLFVELSGHLGSIPLSQRGYIEDGSAGSKRNANKLYDYDRGDAFIEKHLGASMIEWIEGEQSRGNFGTRNVADALLGHQFAKGPNGLILRGMHIRQLPPPVALHAEACGTIDLRNNPLELLPAYLFTSCDVHFVHWSGEYLALGPKMAEEGSEPPTQALAFLALSQTPVAKILDRLPAFMRRMEIFSVFALAEDVGVDELLKTCGADGFIDLEKVETMLSEVIKRNEAAIKQESSSA